MFERQKIVSEERKQIYEVIEKLNKEITDAEAKKAKAEKKVHQKYNKLDMLEKGVKYVILILFIDLAFLKYLFVLYRELER